MKLDEAAEWVWVRIYGHCNMIFILHNNQNMDQLLQTITSEIIELEMRGWSHIVANLIFFAEKTKTLIFEQYL